LRGLNPAAPILDAAQGEAQAAQLIGCGLYDPQRKLPDVARWLAAEAYAGARTQDHRHHHPHAHDRNRHDDRIRAGAFTTADAVPAAAFEVFLDLVRSVHGPNLLRMKGVVKIADQPDRPLVVHGVQHVFHPPAYLERWPDADERTRLVFVTRDLDPAVLCELFQAVLGAPAPDRPDRAALLDNPLAPLGLRRR
jgi:G3E family GTPase